MQRSQRENIQETVLVFIISMKHVAEKPSLFSMDHIAFRGSWHKMPVNVIDRIKNSSGTMIQTLFCYFQRHLAKSGYKFDCKNLYGAIEYKWLVARN